MWQPLLLLITLCQAGEAGGHNCEKWPPKGKQIFQESNFQFTCNGTVTGLRVCCNDASLTSDFRVKLSLFQTISNKGYQVNKNFQNTYEKDVFNEITKGGEFSSRHSIGMVYQVKNGGRASEMSDNSAYDGCIVPILVTTNSDECCNSGIKPYIVLVISVDCTESIASDSEACLHTGTASCTCGTSSDHLSALSTSSTQSLVLADTCNNISAPPWLIAMIVLLLLAIVTESAACAAFWILCHFKKDTIRKKISSRRHSNHKVATMMTPRTGPSLSVDASICHNNNGTTNTDYYESVNLCAQESHATSEPQAREFKKHMMDSNRPYSVVNYDGLYEVQAGFTQGIGIYEMEGDSGNYWHPAGTSESIYSEMKNKQYLLIDKDDIKLTAVLGEGEFGQVYKGDWFTEGREVEVAVKALKRAATEEERAKLLTEAALMGQFQHTHVARMLGVTYDENQILMVMEFLSGGDLEKELQNLKQRSHELQQVLPAQLLSFCVHIADAMSYLSGRGFIHRDLAARNILLDHNMNCKVTDFGMSKDLEGDNYYQAKGGRIPIKWTAPEAVMYRKYSTKSDVWSYGMVMYEIWSLGHKPFEDFSIQQVLEMFDPKGFCQAPPPGCPRGIYSTMIQCWNPDPHKRPTFADVLQILNGDRNTLLLWTEADMVVTAALQLGAPKQTASNLHADLQEKYK